MLLRTNLFHFPCLTLSPLLPLASSLPSASSVALGLSRTYQVVMSAFVSFLPRSEFLITLGGLSYLNRAKNVV